MMEAKFIQVRIFDSSPSDELNSRMHIIIACGYIDLIDWPEPDALMKEIFKLTSGPVALGEGCEEDRTEMEVPNGMTSVVATNIP